jgi:hypothetical protein
MSDSDFSSYILRYDLISSTPQYFNGADWYPFAATATNPAGSNTQVQFNNSGAFGASPNLTFNGTALTVLGGSNSITLNPTAPDFNLIFSGSEFDINQFRIAVESLGLIMTAGYEWINNTGGSYSSSAVLQLDSTTQGFLPPRMTSTQRTAISTPANGLIVYDTTANQLYEYQNTSWVAISGGSSGITQLTGSVTAGPGSGSQAANVNYIVGVTDGSSAATGNVGELIEFSFVNYTTAAINTYYDATTLPLTAGDWDIMYQVSANSGEVSGVTYCQMGIGTVAGNDGTGLSSGQTSLKLDSPTGASPMTIGRFSVSITGPTTYYAKVVANWSGTAPTFDGIISARRMR